MITRRKFVKNLSTGLFIPSILLARKSRAASGMIVDPYKILRPTHTSATAWSAQVVTNGGVAPSAASVLAVSDFFYGLDADGISYTGGSPDLVFYNAFAPDNLIASITPQVNASVTQWTNRNFVLADLTVNGLKGNGTTKSIGTPYLPGTFWSDTSAGLSVYSSTAVAENSYELGVGGNGLNSQFGINVNWSNATASCECWRFDSPNTVVANLPSSPLAGWCSFNRTASNVMAMYFANTANAHAQLGATQTGAQNGTAALGGVFTLEVFAINGAGTIGNWTTRRLSVVSGHKGFTIVKDKALYDRSVALRTSFGGGTV